MQRRIVLGLLWLLCGIVRANDVDPLIFIPAFPTAADEIVMQATAGPCTALNDAPDEIDVVVSANTIEVIVDGYTSPFDDVCGGDTRTTRLYGIGRYPAGEYTVLLTIRDDLTGELFPALETASLLIAPVRRTSVIPAWSFGGAAVLVLLVAVGALGRKHGTACSAILLLGFARETIGAQESAVHAVGMLLRHEPGRPTAADVVEGFDFSSGSTPPVAALATGEPTRSAYLVGEAARGDYAAWLQQHPASEAAKLNRYVAVFYPDAARAASGLAALRADPDVESAYALDGFPFSGGAQLIPYWRSAVGAREDTPERGWATLGIADTGAATRHPALAEFGSDGSFAGGGLRSALSRDFGMTGIGALDDDVDELTPEPALPNYVECDADGDGYLTSQIAGHGTHVAGLLVAREGAGVGGTCRGCSLAVARLTLFRCRKPDLVVDTQRNGAAFVPAHHHLALSGAQVISQSFGSGGLLGNDYCAGHANDPHCLIIGMLVARDIVIVAASGNDRDRLDFPAKDPRVIAAGGVDEGLGLWDEDREGSDLLDGCPTPGKDVECGSNFTQAPGDPRQDFVAPARAVVSTMYPGLNWNSTTRCGDAFGTPIGDGYGECTGTSMAAPMVAGVAGLVRSANPLLASGAASSGMPATGVWQLLQRAAVRPDHGQGWDARLGQGIPRVDTAISATLGVVGKHVAAFRLAPLFTLHSAGALDRAAVATPQRAVALMLGPAEAWSPVGSPVAGFTAFSVQGLAPPAADVFVFSKPPEPTTYAVVPLHSLRRARPWPSGCTPGAPGCHGDHVDHTATTSIAELESLHAQGYEYLGNEGFIHAPCSDEPGCMPPHAIRLLRMCNANLDDCAVVAETRQAELANLGYGPPTTLGYAYPNVDSDADTLIDGWERLLGLHAYRADSDFDGVADGVEYPLAGIPLSDPCPRGVCDESFVFADGYE